MSLGHHTRRLDCACFVFVLAHDQGDVLLLLFVDPANVLKDVQYAIPCLTCMLSLSTAQSVLWSQWIGLLL